MGIQIGSGSGGGGGGGGGTVTSVSGTAPIAATAGNTPVVSIAPADGVNAGSMAAAHYTLVAALPAASAASATTITAGAGLTGGGSLAANRTVNVIANADASIVVNADDIQVGVISDAQHGTRGGGTVHANAIAAGAAGFLTGADKTKLDSLTSGAAVASVSGTAPIASSGGATPAISITAATTGAAGSMSATDKAKLDSLTAATSLTAGSVLFSDGTVTQQDNASLYWDDAANTLQVAGLVSGGKATITSGYLTDHIGAGGVRFARSAGTGAPVSFTYTGAPHTALTASTENVGVTFDASATKQFSTGNFALQREVRFIAPTYSAVGGSTMTTGITVDISGPPTAGTNMAVTNKLALRVTGNARFDVSTLAGQVMFGSTAPDTDGVIRVDSGLGNRSFRNTSGTSSSFSAGLSVGVDQAITAGYHIDVAGAGGVRIARSAASGATSANFLYTGAAHTTQTTTVETPDVDFNCAATLQHAQGNITTQRTVIIRGRTYSFATSSSTVADCYTFAIDAAPVAGTNAVFTRSGAFWIQTGQTRLSGAVVQDSKISPTALAGGTTNDYAPTGLSAARYIRQDVSSASAVSGLVAQQDGQIVTIYNIATSALNTLTLTHDDAGSTAANRFFLSGAASVVIPNYGSVTLQYDSTSSRWRVIAKAL